MTINQLISKLETCNPDAIVLTDKNGDRTIRTDIMGEAIIVATGVAYQVNNENSGTDYWITNTPWQHNWAGGVASGEAAVYIGSGASIIAPLWESK